jgi:hypothetical protein
MTENYPPAPVPASYPPAPASPEYPPVAPQPPEWDVTAPGYLGEETGPGGTTDDDQGTVDVVKDQAADLGQGAVEAGKHAAATAKEQTSAVTAEAARQGRDLARQAQGELAAQASQQQQRLAGSLRALGDELASMASGSENPGVATDLVHQAAGTTRHVASWLEEREPGQLLEDVKTFARQRPGLFIALAAGVGLAAGRLTRGLADSGDDDAAPPATDDALSPAQGETLPPLPELTVADVAPAGANFAPVPEEAPAPSAWDIPADRLGYPEQAGGSL